MLSMDTVQAIERLTLGATSTSEKYGAPLVSARNSKWTSLVT